MRGQHEVELGESGVANHARRELARHRGQLICGREHQAHVAGFVVSGLQWSRASLRDNPRTSTVEANHFANVKEVLIKPNEEKGAATMNWPAQRKSELLLLILRFEIKKGVRGAETGIAQEIEIRAM